jgi:hypothetical protein
VELIPVGDHKPVGLARIDLQRRFLDDLRRQQRRVRNRNDLVVVAMEDQRWDIDLLEVLGEVRIGERLDAFSSRSAFSIDLAGAAGTIAA